MWRAWTLPASSLLIALGGCESADSPPPGETPPPPPSLTVEQLYNAEYRSQWPASGLARLVNGVYRERAAPGAATEIMVRATSFHAFGDLDADGATDAVIVLESEPGGSGVFFDLVPVLNRRGQPQPLAPTALGDRVEIKSLAVLSDGTVTVQLFKHGPDDPQCCPTLDLLLRYRLEGDGLINEGQEPSRRSASPATRKTVHSVIPRAPILS